MNHFIEFGGKKRNKTMISLDGFVVVWFLSRTHFKRRWLQSTIIINRLNIFVFRRAIHSHMCVSHSFDRYIELHVINVRKSNRTHQMLLHFEKVSAVCRISLKCTCDFPKHVQQLNKLTSLKLGWTLLSFWLSKCLWNFFSFFFILCIIPSIVNKREQ